MLCYVTQAVRLRSACIFVLSTSAKDLENVFYVFLIPVTIFLLFKNIFDFADVFIIKNATCIDYKY